jgi:hypothetical protein
MDQRKSYSSPVPREMTDSSSLWDNGKEFVANIGGKGLQSFAFS